MSVRKTESRVPANFAPADLGEAVAAPDGRCALVSFVTSPLVVGRENIYVVFVTDAALAASVESLEWSFSENGGAPSVQTTDFGEFAYTPTATGQLSLTVRLLGASNSDQATLALTQEITALQAEIEAAIAAARNDTGPGIGNPEVAREIVNDHSPYHQDVTLHNPESGDAFQRFVFGVTYEGALQRPPAQRKEQLNQLAASLNNGGADFKTIAAAGAGLCRIRLSLLAMTLSSTPGGGTPLLPWTEVPEAASERAAADDQVREALAALDESTRLDLFNLVRFPKSNVTQCARIIETLRDHYFSGTNFEGVLTGMSGTRAFWITRHFREGPLVT
jgi:hypothetical protein